MSIRRHHIILSLLAAVFVSDLDASQVGTTQFAVGNVTDKGLQSDVRVLSRGSDLFSGDTVDTGLGRAQLRFLDGNFVSLQPSTVFRIDDYRYVPQQKTGNSLVLEVVKGGLRMVTGAIGKQQPEAVAVKTPVATIGIRGTGFTVRLCKGDCVTKKGGRIPDGLYAYVTNGRIIVSNNVGRLEIPSGKGVYVENADTAPVYTPVYPLALPEKMPVDSHAPADNNTPEASESGSAEAAQLSGSPDASVSFLEAQIDGGNIATMAPQDNASVNQAGEQLGPGGLYSALPLGSVGITINFP